MAPTDNRTITLPLNEFLDMQDKLANAMNTYRSISMKILEASSNSLGTTADALTNLHSYTTSALVASGVSPTSLPVGSFPTISQLLKNSKDKIRDFDSLNLPHAGVGEKSKKSKAPRKPKDPDAPKRPDTAYLRFANQNRENYASDMKQDDPSITRGAIAKKLTSDWNAMDEKAQQPYKDSYRKEMAAYNVKKADYEKRTGKKVDDKEVDEDEEQAVATMSGLKEGADDSEEDTSSDDDDEPAKTAKAAKAKGAVKKDTAKSPGKKAAAADAGKKKRKHDEDDAGKKEDDGKSKKKKKSVAKGSTPIDPRLEKIDKDSKRQKRKSQHGDDY